MIKAEIERLKGICTAQIKANPGQTFPFVMEMTGYDKLLAFIDSLPNENNPDPNNRHAIDLIARMREVTSLIKYIDSLTDEQGLPMQGL